MTISRAEATVYCMTTVHVFSYVLSYWSETVATGGEVSVCVRGGDSLS